MKNWIFLWGDDIFLPMQQLNHLRRQGLEALEKEMLRPWKQRKAKERDLKDIPETEKQTTKEFLTAAVETEEQLLAIAHAVRNRGLSLSGAGLTNPEPAHTLSRDWRKRA